jgi:hypothetical protein
LNDIQNGLDPGENSFADRRFQRNNEDRVEIIRNFLTCLELAGGLLFMGMVDPARER